MPAAMATQVMTRILPLSLFRFAGTTGTPGSVTAFVMTTTPYVCPLAVDRLKKILEVPARSDRSGRSIKYCVLEMRLCNLLKTLRNHLLS